MMYAFGSISWSAGSGCSSSGVFTVVWNTRCSRGRCAGGVART
jgi:hypothetical protein